MLFAPPGPGQRRRNEISSSPLSHLLGQFLDDLNADTDTEAGLPRSGNEHH